MTFSFKKFDEIVSANKVDIVVDESTLTYLYMALFSQLEVEEIDFDRITFSGIENARDGISESITHEDEEGNILLDPHHTMFRVLALSYKIFGFEEAPKQAVPSSFRFL